MFLEKKSSTLLIQLQSDQQNVGASAFECFD